MSDCICGSTPKSECTYHGALRHSTTCRIWPVQPAPAAPAEDLRVTTVTISRKRYEELREIEVRAKELPGLRDYWRCFHCDFQTASKAEAEAHFGDRDDAEEFKPLCKWWSRMDEGERREQFQSLISQLNAALAEAQQ